MRGRIPLWPFSFGSRGRLSHSGMDWSGPSIGLIRRNTPVRFRLPPVEVNVADELENVIRENAAGPAKASSDGTSMEQHPLTDQIAVAKHVGGKQAMNSPTFGLRTAKIVSPGAV